jgi:glycerophosphoryl diester phosphodiesterase
LRAPDWLTARPVAHRGLHDRARGIIENMPGAAQAAIDTHFGIECDIQLTADGEAMVHHDDALGRLTEGSGALLGMTAAELKTVRFKDTSERMMSLGDLCALVAGRVPLVIEVKSHFDGDRRLVARMAQVLASYRGPVAGMSFDPDQVLALRESMPELPAASPPNAAITQPTGRARHPPSAMACCICVTRSAPGRISSPMGSTSCRRRRPGLPATFSACRF